MTIEAIDNGSGDSPQQKAGESSISFIKSVLGRIAVWIGIAGITLTVLNHWANFLLLADWIDILASNSSMVMEKIWKKLGSVIGLDISGATGEVSTLLLYYMFITVAPVLINREVNEIQFKCGIRRAVDTLLGVVVYTVIALLILTIGEFHIDHKMIFYLCVLTIFIFSIISQLSFRYDRLAIVLLVILLSLQFQIFEKLFAESLVAPRKMSVFPAGVFLTLTVSTMLAYPKALRKRLIFVFICFAIALGLSEISKEIEETRTQAIKGAFDRGDNSLWMRRHWLHEGPTEDEIVALVQSLRARGIRRIYPFLGPPDREGWPGWRSKAGLVRYLPERSEAFLRAFHQIAPEIRVMPWTGGILNSDLNLEDQNQRRAFVEHARRLIMLGADGVHLDVEPLPTGTRAYLDLLTEMKAAIGEHTLSVAAYPPAGALRANADGYWELSFMREVCGIANEIAVMAYDTGITSGRIFEHRISEWTLELAEALSQPSGGGCEWLMGVPAYDDDKNYHRPDVETIQHSLRGLTAGLEKINMPANFRGVAIYASFSASASKWATYDRLWRGVEPVKVPPPDPRNSME